MTNEEYHSDTSRISKSGLDLIDRSPAHYYSKYLDPNRVKAAKEKKWATEGTLAHTLILEPETFNSKYKVLPANAPKYPTSQQIGAKNPSADTQKAIQFYRDLELQHPGVEIISPEMYSEACRMRDSVLKHPTAGNLFSRGKAEQTILFDDKETSAPCKCRPDWLTDYQFVVDLKTSEDASADAFGRSAANYRYHVQAPFYIDGINANFGHSRVEFFAFVVVEKSPPYAVAVYVVSPQDMNFGREIYMRNLRTYMMSRESNSWPAYSPDFQPLKLPTWLTRNYEQI